MIDCHKCAELIKACIAGRLDERDLASIEEHVRSCEPCRREYEKCRKLETAVKSAFECGACPSKARERIVRLAAQARLDATVHSGPALSNWRWKAAAAVVVVAFAGGILAGTGLNREIQRALHAVADGDVALRTAEVKGTVLRRERGADWWAPVKNGDPLKAGDEITTGAKSELVLWGKDGSAFRLGGASGFLVKTQSGEVEIELSYGEMRATLAGPHPLFSVITPQGRIRAPGMDFTVSVD